MASHPLHSTNRPSRLSRYLSSLRCKPCQPIVGHLQPQQLTGRGKGGAGRIAASFLQQQEFAAPSLRPVWHAVRDRLHEVLRSECMSAQFVLVHLIGCWRGTQLKQRRRVDLAPRV